MFKGKKKEADTKKKKVSKKPVKEQSYTDILEEQFMEGSDPKIKRTFMNGSKVVREEVVNA